MNVFHYQNSVLFAENKSAVELVSEFGSPLYVYSKKEIETAWNSYADAIGDKGLICYAVKANSNLAILNLLARKGSGFDIVSIGELERVLKAGGKPEKIVFSGVAKQPHEMRRALEVGIHCFNIESVDELHVLNDVASKMKLKAPISIRVNPDVDAKTHPYISTGLKQNKFGIDIHSVEAVYQLADALDHIDVKGVDCHIGSQITEIAPFFDALERLLQLIDRLAEKGIHLDHLDLGGGIGVQYQDKDDVPSVSDYISQVLDKISGRNIQLIMEPGRSIVAKAGIFLTQVVYLKQTEEHNFAIVDGGMNDLIRPALYQAWQEVKEVTQKELPAEKWDVVGPICETGDFLAHDRSLSIQQGDLLAVMDSGAYGFTMSSNYNSRNRVAEVLVDNDQAFIVRKRETIDDQLALESVLPGE